MKKKNFFNQVFARLSVLLLLFVSFGHVMADEVQVGELKFRTDCDKKTATVIGVLSSCPPNVVIPSSIYDSGMDFDVTSIGGSAFRGCSGLTSITIPNSVTSIGGSAFRGCSGLTSITIPNSVESIGYEAFNDCSGLTSFTLANGPKPLKLEESRGNGSFVFRGCPIKTLYVGRDFSDFCYSFYVLGSTESLTIGNCVTYIRSEQFGEMSHLTSVTIEDGRDTLKSRDRLYGVFDGSPIETLYLGRNLNHREFSGMKTLKSVTFANCLTSIDKGAFSECSGLTSVTIPNSVTSIGEMAFWGCSGLTSLTIPNSVTSIGENAFSGCSGLTSLTIPNSVTSIDRGAFSGCSGLTSLTIPNSVTSIDRGAFRGCSGLTSVTIPNSVTSIGGSAFWGCSGLTSITIPGNVTSIGQNAFDYCEALTSITLESGQETLNCGIMSGSPIEMLYLDRLLSYNPDSSPFKNNTSLKTVTVGNGVAHLPAGLFNGCSNLQSIITSNLKVNVDENAFDKASFQNLWVNGCTPDDAIALAGSSAWAPFTHLGYREGDEQYAPIVCREPLTLTGTTYYTNTNGALVLPNRRLTVTASSEPIGKVMFRNQEVSGQITSAEGFTFKSTSCWKENIFYSQDAASGKSRTIEMTKAGDLIRLLGLSDAKNVENLTIIGVINGTDVLAINNMPQLRYLDLSRANIVEGGSAYRDNLKTQNNVVGSYFFHALENIEMVFLPETATRIETHVLDGKSTLRSVVMGNSLLSIGQKAFSGCSSLFNVTLPEKVSSIGSSAFSGCTGLTSITIPAGVNTIGESAFSGCTGLTSITIPASVNTIGESAFYLCTDLVSVTVENKETSLKLVGNSSNLFSGCSIETLYLGRDIAGTGSPFKNSTSLKTLTLGEKVTAIIPSMFSGCTGLTSITIPAGVNTIGESAFSGCTGLTSITIPASVNTIGESAFYLCTDLVSVTVENKETSLKLVGNSSNLFSGCSIETLYLGRDIAGTGSPFKNSTSLKTLTFGEKVTAIIPSMFSGCTGLTSITIPDQVTSIGSSAFSDCTGLTSITIPASVNTIGESAFSGCTGLTNVTAEDGKSNLNLEGNPGNLFSGNNIETLYLGRNIAGTASPFKNNTSLKKLTLGNKVTTIISSMFSGCTGLTSVTIPDQVTSIGSSAFWGCASLQDAVIGSGVKEIGALVFRGCNHLTNLALGENVSSIANDAFYGCSAITKIISLNPEPPQISFDVFEDVDKSVCKLIVCSGCMGYYWLVPAWKEFINMSEEDMVAKSDKAYKIKCGRGYWKTQDDRHVKIVNDESDADLYAFIKRNNFVYYIYNVTEKKFLCKESGDAVFSNENLEEIDAIYFHETGNSNYPVYFTNQNNHYFNVNGSSYLVVNSWSTLDDGNQFALIEAADFDAEALSEAQRILSGEKEQITLADLPRAKYGDAPIDLTAGFPEGVTLKFESSNTNVARINGTMLQIVGAGKATITTSVPEGDKTIEIISGQERQLVVDKANLTVTAKSYEINAGNAMPTFELLFDGFVNGDTQADIDKLPTITCSATDTNMPGEFEICLTGGTDDNYNLSLVTGKLTIHKMDGIEQIGLEPEYDVYNLHGVKLMTKATKKDLKRLTPGIYIINGKKVVIK